MTKGTPSKGKKSKGRTHRICRRCGRHAYHTAKKICAACGYGKSSKLRKTNYMAKRVNRERKHGK